MKRLRRERDHRAGPDQAGGDVGDFRQLRVVAVAVDDRLLEIRMQRRLRRVARKRVPSRMPSAPSASAATRPRPSAIAARRQHRDRRHRVDHHGHERHAGHPADMAAALAALRDDDVGAGLDGALGFRHRAGHVGDLAAGLVRAVEIRLQILLGPRPGELHHRRPQFERGGEAVLARVEQQKIQPERLVGLPRMLRYARRSAPGSK